MTIYEKLAAIQAKLKAPKDLENKFGGYRYRSAEGILEAVKPLLTENKCVLLLKDGLESIEGRVYIKATATLVDIEIVGDAGEHNDDFDISVTAFAREDESKKGMDACQVTGAASSYARKYALNGLFCIDDNKDSDFTNDKKEIKSAPIPMDKDALVCAECGKEIDQRVYDWSMKKYGRPLCRGCQK